MFSSLDVRHHYIGYLQIRLHSPLLKLRNLHCILVKSVIPSNMKYLSYNHSSDSLFLLFTSRKKTLQTNDEGFPFLRIFPEGNIKWIIPSSFYLFIFHFQRMISPPPSHSNVEVIFCTNLLTFFFSNHTFFCLIIEISGHINLINQGQVISTRSLPRWQQKYECLSTLFENHVQSEKLRIILHQTVGRGKSS